MPKENRLTAVIAGTSERVYRSRAVYLSDDFKCTMLTTNAISFTPAGIAQEWCRQPPGTPYNTSMQAGVSGDEIMIYGPGSDALAEVGSAGVIAGVMVTVDSTARVVSRNSYGTISTVQWNLGVAMEDGAEGDVVRIRVMPVLQTPSTAAG